MNGALHEDPSTVIIQSLLMLLRIRNVSGKSCREDQNTHFMSDNSFFKNRAVYEIIRKKYGTVGETTDDYMAHAHCMLDT
jgi:hypothetical protein